jgi:hypothetical protein
MTAYRQVITEVVALVEEQGVPLTIGEISAALAVPAAEIFRQVRAYDVDIDADRLALCDTRPEVFIIPDADEDHHRDCDDCRVGLSGTPSRDLLGVRRFDAAILGTLYRAATELSAREPDNSVLAEAVEKLRARFLPGLRPASPSRASVVAQLGRAMGSGHRVRIRYSRAWEPGVLEREIEPYVLAWTRRGAEVDAGPVQPDRTIRSYLVSRIEDLVVLDETFVRPDDADALSDAARSTTTVTGVVPADRLWVVEMAAESLSVTKRQDDLVWFTAELLPPVAWRAGRLTVVAGDRTQVDSPQARAAAAAIARRVWEHHRLDDLAA